MRDASEVIAEIRARATFLRDRGDDFLNVEAEKMDAWANRLAAAEPADAGRDAVAFLCDGTRFKLTAGPRHACYYSFPVELGGRWVALVDAIDNKHMQLTRPPSEAAAAVDDAMVERAVEAFLANTGQAHTVTQLQRDLTTGCMRAALTAALASQPPRSQG